MFAFWETSHLVERTRNQEGFLQKTVDVVTLCTPRRRK